MPRTNNATDWLIALRAPGAGARRLLAALNQHGSIANLRQQARQGLSGLPVAAEQYLRQPDENKLATDLEWLAGDPHHLITWDNNWYPGLLRDTAGPPVALFVVGDPGVLWQPQVAVVGSRKPTPGGRDHARGFAGSLARHGFVITSGLATGIDATAHQAAVDCGGRTIAVLGTGPDRVYPARNHALAQRIVTQGALISEWPPGTSARPGHFPARNRIISGLSLGVLVVEASEKSGSLITARLAGEQGREVLAIPGSIQNPMARGCHRLIREGGRLVDRIDHVVEDLQPLAARLAQRLRVALAEQTQQPDADMPAPDVGQEAPASAGEMAVAALDEEYRQLLSGLGYEPMAIDQMVEKTDLTPEAVSSMLLILELKGLVVSHPGGTWSLHHEIV